jgi:hypothetical protein
MSERRPGVPRLRHGAGVGVGQVCAEGTVHGPIVSRQPLACFPDPKFWQKRTQKLWYTAGWESRSVGWVTGVDACATGTRRLCGHDLSLQYASSCTPGLRPGVPCAALLHGQLQLSSGTTAMLDTLSHTHGCVHRTERVQQQPTATIIRCVQWMQRSGNHIQSLWRPACRPHSTHNHKPWVQFCTHACFTNHGLYTGCNLYPFYKPWFVQGMQIAPRIQTMVCIRGAICIPCNKPWFVYGVQFAPLLQTMICKSLRPMRSSFRLLQTRSSFLLDPAPRRIRLFAFHQIPRPQP